MSTSKTIKSALISVFHKDGLAPIVEKLNDLDVTIYSTGGTEKFITASNIKGYIAGSTINFTGTVQIGGKAAATEPFAIAQAVALG